MSQQEKVIFHFSITVSQPFEEVIEDEDKWAILMGDLLRRCQDDIIRGKTMEIVSNFKIPNQRGEKI